jgi:hypothetical protein
MRLRAHRVTDAPAAALKEKLGEEPWPKEADIQLAPKHCPRATVRPSHFPVRVDVAEFTYLP